MESTDKIQGQTARMEMGVNDMVIHLEEARLQVTVFLLDKHLQGLFMADDISPDTSHLVHEVTVRNQAGSGVVVRVSIDGSTDVATKVDGTFLGWNRLGVDGTKQ
jgi:hypothetical protein